MGNVLAVVAKAIFDKQARGAKGTLAVGDVWATAAYVSKNTNLTPLAAGGALFLVTVRPPDERLWLVAILEGPRFADEAWSAAANRVPITDVTALLDKLRFTSGKGISADPGKLGMSLQTPRELTDADAALLRSAVGSTHAEVSRPAVVETRVAAPSRAAKPAEATQAAVAAGPKPLETPPSDDVLAALTKGYDALDPKTTASIEDVRKLARKAPKKSVAALKTLATKLGVTIAARLGYHVLAVDLLLRAPDHAGSAFAAARAIDKKLATTLPVGVQLAATAVFARAGRGWFELLEAWQLVDVVREHDPAAAAAFAARWLLMPSSAYVGVDDAQLTLIRGTLGRIRETLIARHEALPVAPPSGRDSTRSRTFDLAILELLLEAEMPLDLTADGALRASGASLFNGKVSPPFRQLRRVGVHPVFAPLVAELVFPSTQKSSNLGERFAALGDVAGAEVAFAAIAAHLEAIGRGTLGNFEANTEYVEAATQSVLVRRWPAIAQALATIDPARLLAAQLRAGLLDEWEWPALDDLVARFDGDLASFRWESRWTCGAFPFLGRHDSEGHRVAIAGPDGVVLDLTYDSKLGELTSFRGTASEVFAWFKDAPKEARGLVHGGRLPFDERIYNATYDGKLVHQSGVLMTAGATPGPLATTGFRYGLAVDGDLLVTFDAQTYAADGRVAVTVEEADEDEGETADDDADDETKADADPNARFLAQRFDPRTGTLSASGFPAWMTEPMRSDPKLRLVGACSYAIGVPARAERSPLGAKDGIGGLVVYEREGRHLAVRSDGRRWEGGRAPAALLTFPGREALWVLLDSDEIPGLVPADGLDDRRYWPTRAQEIAPWFFHLFTPRDEAGSRALATCGDEQARAIVEAALASLRAVPDAVAPRTTLDYGDLAATITNPKRNTDLAVLAPELLATVSATFPEITHPKLIVAVASMARIAAEAAEKLASCREQSVATTDDSGFANTDVDAVGTLFGHEPHWWHEALGTRLGAQITAVDGFLFGTEPGPLTPPRTIFPWRHTLVYLGELLYRALALGTPPKQRAALVRFLEHWATTKLADADGHHVRIVQLAFAQAPLAGFDKEHADRCVAWENRYFLHLQGANQSGQPIFDAIEVAADGIFRLPPGATLEWEKRLDLRWPAEVIRKSLALLAARGPAPFSAEARALVAQETGLGVAAASLLISAADRPWPPTKEVRAALGLKPDDEALGHLDLQSFRGSVFYSAALPDDPASLYAPVEKTNAAGAAKRAARVWIEGMGKQAPFPLELARRLQSDLGDALPRPDRGGRAFMNPEHFPALTTDARWYAPRCHPFYGYPPRGDGAPRTTAMPPSVESADSNDWFSGFALVRYAPLLAWAAGNLSVGDPAHDGARRMVTLLRARLAHPELLLYAGALPTSGIREPALRARRHDELKARFAARTYAGIEGFPAGEGFDRGDLVTTWPTPRGNERPNGFFFAFRPGPLDDDATRRRFLTDLDLPEVADLAIVGTRHGLGFAEETTIDTRAFGYFLAWRTAAFQRLLDELAGSTIAEGRYAADPRASAPAVVRAVEKTNQISPAGATLLLQLRVLAEPTVDRLQRFNDWSRATYDGAAKELTAKKLIVVAQHARTDRTHFVPGPMAPMTQPARPFEASKAPLYGLDASAAAAQKPVFGVVLPLMPFAEMFARAAAG